MKFTIRGKTFELTKEIIEEKMKGVKPEGKSKYVVTVNNNVYPIKQVISSTTGLPHIGFNTQDAYRILSRLGFEVKYEKNDK